MQPHVRNIGLLLPIALLSGCAPPAPLDPPSPASLSAFSLAAELIDSTTGADRASGARIGGLSGIVALRDGRELLAVSDDPKRPMVFRFVVSQEEDSWRMKRGGVVALALGGGAPSKLDAEGIALTAEGHILISSEGVGGETPRLPPAIIEYSPEGRFIRQLHVHSRYSPNPEGTVVRGVRANAGFESLTTSPDYSRLFTAVEGSLAQDGPADPFAPAARSRLLEYARDGLEYRPAREFAYELDPLERPSFGVQFAVNGLVELLAIDNTNLLAMERAFVESADRVTSLYRIRIFRISLADASDISAMETLVGADTIKPVRKTLLLDLSGLPGLSRRLSALDNFEGLAWGPPGPGGRRPLILVSDDNFSDKQVTAFLFLRPGQPERWQP